MNLIHRKVVLRHGSVIRIIGSKCMKIPKDTIYQYVVDLLFPGNNWQRIWVSRLYPDSWSMLIHIGKFISGTRKHFHVRTLTKQARKKYGQEYQIGSQRGSDCASLRSEERR